MFYGAGADDNSSRSTSRNATLIGLTASEFQLPGDLETTRMSNIGNTFVGDTANNRSTGLLQNSGADPVNKSHF